MKVKKSKKYADGGPLQAKPKKAPVKMVESEMTPGKMIPESAVRKGAYITMDKKAPAKAAPKKKMKDGGSLKAVPADKQKSLGKLPTPVRNKMGFQKDGGKTKAKGGAKVAKKMMGGGKCKYGC